MTHSNWNDSILLVDSRYICYRSVYALFSKPIGEVKDAMFYGYMKTLLSLASGLKVGKTVITPKLIVSCWDSKLNLRKMVYKGYKRKDKIQTKQQALVLKEMGEGFVELMQWLKKFNFPTVVRTGYEADDIFASYTENPRMLEDNYIIVTSDEDIYQLLWQNKVAIYKLGKKPVFYQEEDFSKDYDGLSPVNWPHVKAIAGCKSDNIPGVPGIGEKRAIQYINPRLELGGKYVKAIKDNNDTIMEYLELVKLPYKEAMFNNLPRKKSKINWEAFTRFCQIYNFRSFMVKFSEFRERFDP